MLDSVSRKIDFVARAVTATGCTNTHLVTARAEAWPEGVGVHDVVTIRAVAPLDVLCEYAAPLLRVGGTLLAWKGTISDDERAEGARAAAQLGLGEPIVHPVTPFAATVDRCIVEVRKHDTTPDRFPRRPGVARKRPLGAVRT
jgi:16S rRNA (guanine527-N7)-methyltransferase